MVELNFKDDSYRNNSKANQLLGIQYFFKRQEDSPWEVYSSYNPNTGLLSLHYYDIYGSEPQYPVFYISLSESADALIATNLLEKNANYLWTKSSPKNKNGFESLAKKVERKGFRKSKSENGIITWKKLVGETFYTIIVENSVALSFYFFEGTKQGKERPLLAVRNISSNSCIDNISKYLDVHIADSK